MEDKYSWEGIRLGDSATDTLVWGMSEAFEVRRVRLSFLAFIPPFSLVLILGLTVVRNSRSDLAVSHSSFVMRVAYGRRLLVNGL
jgi:hypothetical protein